MAITYPTTGDTTTKGAQGELIACAWLLGLGFEVFRNVSASGPADIIAWHRDSDKAHFIDVKCTTDYSAYQRPDGSIYVPMGASHHPLVHKLIVCGGNVLGFYRKVPGGAEAYWPLECEVQSLEPVPFGDYRQSQVIRKERLCG